MIQWCFCLKYKFILLINNSYYIFLCCFLVSKLCLTLCGVRVDCSPLGSSLLENSTGVGCHSLPQRIFSDPGLNPSIPHWRQILYHWATREVWWFIFLISLISLKLQFLRAFKKNEYNIKLFILFYFWESLGY